MTEDSLKYNSMIVPNSNIVKEIKKGNYTISYKKISNPNTDHFKSVIKKLQKMIPKGTKICLVLKSKNCDYNILPYAKAIDDNSSLIEYISVQSIEDAIRLRLSGIKKPIMLLYAHSPRYYELLIKFNIEPSFIIPNDDKYIDDYKKLKFHLWIDTGMGRDGLMFQELKNVDLKKYTFSGIGTHLNGIPYVKRNGNKDKLVKSYDLHHTNNQIKNFNNTIKQFDQLGLKFKHKHAAASPAIQINRSGAFYNLIRVGRLFTDNKYKNRNSSVLIIKTKQYKTHISQIKDVKKGTCIGYMGDKKISKNMRIGMLSASESRYLGKDINVMYKKNDRQYILPVLLSHGSITIIDLRNVPIKVNDVVYLNEPNGVHFEINIPIDSFFSGEIFDVLRNDKFKINKKDFLFSVFSNYLNTFKEDIIAKFNWYFYKIRNFA